MVSWSSVYAGLPARAALRSMRCCAKLKRSPGGWTRPALMALPPVRHHISVDAPTPRVDYRTEPSRYRHWRLAFDGPLATLSMDVAEDAPLEPGYKLQLNSYDLGVDIELADALNRIRFEHPEVRAVILTSARERIFCSGANIFMLGASSHSWKVNFCKFTND